MGDLTDKDAPLTGLSFGTNKFKGDVVQAGTAIKDYVNNTTFDEFTGDVVTALGKVETYENITGGLFLGGALKVGRLVV